MVFKEISSEEELSTYFNANPLVLLHFYTEWSDECSDTNDLLQHLSAGDENLVALSCEAEKCPEFSKKYGVVAVPTVVFFIHGFVKDIIVGARIAEVRNLAKKYMKTENGNDGSKEQNSSKSTLNEKLESLIKKSNIMVFMKGDKNVQKCGFSSTLIKILNDTGLDYETFDILEDDEVRQGLKTFSNWPTYPQVYAKGELIGGLDIVRELLDNGTLLSVLKSE